MTSLSNLKPAEKKQKNMLRKLKMPKKESVVALPINH